MPIYLLDDFLFFCRCWVLFLDRVGVVWGNACCNTLLCAELGTCVRFIFLSCKPKTNEHIVIKVWAPLLTIPVPLSKKLSFISNPMRTQDAPVNTITPHWRGRTQMRLSQGWGRAEGLWTTDSVHTSLINPFWLLLEGCSHGIQSSLMWLRSWHHLIQHRRWLLERTKHGRTVSWSGWSRLI